MLRESRGKLICTLALLGSLSLLCCYCEAKPDYTGLYGPYCATRYPKQRCCLGRRDDCSVPILGTLCYCDDFCSNRTAEADCCPDFWSHCREDGPEPIRLGTCTYHGKILNHGDTFRENCNTCKCSSLEEDSCKIMCENNKCLIEQEIIDQINKFENLGWVARNYSEFWGRTLSDGLSLRTGTINPSHSVYRMYVPKSVYNPEHLPREFDARESWRQYVNPIRDQGWCGASWAVSSVDVASDRFAIMSKGTEKVLLSAQHLIACNSRGQQACSGGSLDRAWFFIKRFGLVDEDCHPWVGHAERCVISRKGKLSDVGCRSRNSYTLRDEYYKVGPAYRLGNETDIMHEILTSGPVQATMRVYLDFFTYESGIYVHSSMSESHVSEYHSVRIVGWGEEPSSLTGRPVKFWRVANSWGRGWGEDGYFRILRGTNECEIESFVVGVWAKTV